MTIPLNSFAFVTAWLALGATAAFSQTISVATYGGIPDDGIDDTAAIQAALSAASKLPGSTVAFSPGAYDVAAPAGQSQALILTGATDVTLDGATALIRVGTPKNALLVSNSENVTIKGLTFEWKKLSFAQVRTVSFVNGVATVQFLGGEAPSTSGTTVTSVFMYDLVNGRPAPGDNEWYTSTGIIKGMSGGLATITGIASNFSRVGIGANLVIRYQTYGAAAVFGLLNKDLCLDRVTVNSVPGMGFVFAGCENVTLTKINVEIPAGSNRWISSNADAVHFTGCRGRITITDAVLEKMGDDAVNIGGLMMRSKMGSSTSEIIVRHGATSQQGMPPMHVGDVLRFSAPSTPYVSTFKATVIAGPSTGLPTVMTLTLDRAVPAALLADAIVYNETAKPTFRIARCLVSNNRARGFCIQGAAGVIENSTVSGSSGPAAELRCDVNRWWEGPAPSNVEFYACQFADCNYGPGKGAAMVNAFAQQGDGSFCNEVVLKDLTFHTCSFAGAASGLCLNSAGVVKTAFCTYGTAAPAILTLAPVSVIDDSGY